jgi:Zn-dependent protease
MKQSIRLGRVAGIPVGMQWTVAVIVALITGMLAGSVLPSVIPHQPAGLYWAAAVAGSVLFVAALAAHEIAHAIVARHRGVKVRSITLWMLGGITELEGDPPTAAADLQIAIAGPATSLAAGIVFGGAAVLARSLDGPAVFTAALAWLSLMNVTLAVFNPLPGAPLDGRRILRGLLWKRYGDRQRASRAAARSGQVLGTGITAIGVLELLTLRDITGGLWLMLIGWSLVTAARAEQRSEAVRARWPGCACVMSCSPTRTSAVHGAMPQTSRPELSSPHGKACSPWSALMAAGRRQRDREVRVAEPMAMADCRRRYVTTIDSITCARPSDDFSPVPYRPWPLAGCRRFARR